MKKPLSTVPFNGTPEQEAQLHQAIENLRNEKGCLMPIMQEAQAIYGYLPIEVQTIIANDLDISVEEVYGVSTFYSMFNLSPKGEYAISVCLGTACYVKGGDKILDALKSELKINEGEVTADGKFSIDVLRCVGACGLAPVMTINGKTYGRLVPEQVKGILAEYAD